MALIFCLVVSAIRLGGGVAANDGDETVDGMIVSAIICFLCNDSVVVFVFTKPFYTQARVVFLYFSSNCHGNGYRNLK